MKSFIINPETELQLLNKIDEKLIHDIKVILSDDTIIKYLPFQTAPDEQVVRSFLDKIMGKCNFVWGIKTHSELKGVIDFIRIDDDTISLAYFLSPSLHGRGIISTAIKLVTEYIFNECGVSYIIAPVVSRNSASIRVLEKNGFILYKKVVKCVNFDGLEDEVYHFRRCR